MQQTVFFKWADLLDLLEQKFPRAFDFFYHFHSSFGLEEGDLHPSERLMDIGEHSDCAYRQLLFRFGVATLPDLTDNQRDAMQHDITAEGIAFVI